MNQDEQELQRLLEEARRCRQELVLKRTGSFNNTFVNLNAYDEELIEINRLIGELESMLQRARR